MSVRVYQENILIKDHVVELAANAALHIARVLRMRVGESLILFNGTNLEFECEIVTITKSKVTVQVLHSQTVNRESPLKIHLAQGLSKGERMDWVVQKAVELGVSEITPLITQHNVVKLAPDRVAKKLEHWRGIAIHACEQSGRNQLPHINEPLEFKSILKHQAATKIILHPACNASWPSLSKPPTEVLILIGPEGGFSDAEVKLALSCDFQAVTLGPRVLRTETAAVAALTVLQLVWGDLKGSDT